MDVSVSWTITDPTGTVTVRPRPDGQRDVAADVGDAFAPRTAWTTGSSDELIEMIVAAKGAAWTCDELMRLEDPSYLARDLQICLGAYVGDDDLDGRRILDFGSGSGASAVLLAERLPRAQIVGVELVDDLVAIARRRAVERSLANVTFLRSPSPDRLPAGLGTFGVVCFNAVWEHLLPTERNPLLAQVWAALDPGGVLFVNQTPDRRFPVEMHTTGLPLVNYLPLPLAVGAARRWSARVGPRATTEELLRMGLRGGTPGEIAGVLGTIGAQAEWLRPAHLGLRHQAQAWFRVAGGRSQHGRWSGRLLRAAERVRLPVAPYLSLAVRKADA